MICPKCGENIVLSNSKFCPECGAKIEALPKTPDLKKVFTGVKSIELGVGNEINIMPSSTKDTTITIKASEELKRKLKFSLNNGILSIDEPSSGGTSISITNTHGGNISVVGGRVISGNVMIGRGNRIAIGNSSTIIGDGVDDNVVITITTPAGTDISIDTSGGIEGTIGDLMSQISVDTSGGCHLDIGKITDFDADVSGSLTANIASFEGGLCNVDVSGSCTLNIPSGKIEKLIADVSGSTRLSIKAETEKAVLDVSGSLSGSLRADIVRKDVSGHDSLTIIR